MQFSEKYVLTEELGKGQSNKFGRIFSGTSKITGERVTLKFISKNGNKAGFERLTNERTFDFQIKGLPSIIDFFESENECILVRNFEEGITLTEFWKSVAKKDRLTVLIQLLQKMERIFSDLKTSEVVHCDIKPSNILVKKTEDDLEIVLIDFGLAIRTVEPENRKILFPLGFAAPELLLNELELVDQRTDLFALGITCWNLFTGELPLTHPNPSIFTNLQLTHPLPDHSSLPKGLYPILKKMTNKHVFRTAPNLMTAEERKMALKEGLLGRYDTLSEVLIDLHNLPVKKNWFGF
jgi:serine/threonine protein kinase